MRFLPLLIVLAATPVIASEPASEAHPAPAAAAVPASTPATATQPAKEAAAAAAAPAAAAATAEEPFKIPAGYKKKKRAGETVYCRSETPVGTRFPTEYCFTQNDLERIEKNKQSIQRDVQLRTKMCTTGSACSGGG